jgi:cysteine synthase A
MSTEQMAHLTMCTTPSQNSRWVNWAINVIEADYCRSADTHLLPLPLPKLKDLGIDLYLKDESTHPTGSLKHRLARSLFLYALCNGWLAEGKAVVEASSGSTAVSEAYFARLLGLPFYAVMTKSTSPEKIAQVEFYGGQCHFVDNAKEVYSAARMLAVSIDGHYMDQFTYAERATDWRGNNNIAESIYTQMARERFPVPKWIVVGAGTGGTSATIGRYVRYEHFDTRLCLADPEGSVFADYWRTRDPHVSASGSKIEGIGRPETVPSFLPSLVDDVCEVPNTESMAAMVLLDTLLGRLVGPSTGTNFAALLAVATQMRLSGETGSVVSLLCDSGNRYLKTYHDSAWREAQFGDISSALAMLRKQSLLNG